MSDIIFRELIQGSGKFTFGKAIATPILEKLEPAVYTIEIDEKHGIILSVDREKFASTNLKYSNHKEIVKKVLDIYDKRPATTAAYFRGNKGTGKTAICTEICNSVLSYGIPVVRIDKNIPVSILYPVIKALGHCCVFIDEFERKYVKQNGDNDDVDNGRSDFLELLTDKDLVRVLFLFSDNDKTADETAFINRPDRIQYLCKFDHCDYEDFQEVYGEDFDKLPKSMQKYIEGVIKSSGAGYDSMENIAKFARSAKTLTEFISEIYNRNICFVPMVAVKLINYNYIGLNKENLYIKLCIKDRDWLGRKTENDSFTFEVNFCKVKDDSVENSEVINIPVKDILTNEETDTIDVNKLTIGNHELFYSLANGPVITNSNLNRGKIIFADPEKTFSDIGRNRESFKSSKEDE